MNQIVIGTAGHIDHGKTSLVKALTGTDTDQLIEENKWPEGLDSRQNFTKLQIDSNGNSTKSTFYVVGPIELITKKLAQGD